MKIVRKHLHLGIIKLRLRYKKLHTMLLVLNFLTTSFIHCDFLSLKFALIFIYNVVDITIKLFFVALGHSRRILLADIHWT